MKHDRRDLSFALLALAGAALSLILIASWLNEPNAPAAAERPPARSLPPMTIIRTPSRVQVIEPHDHRGIRLSPEPDATERCRTMLRHVQAITAAAQASDARDLCQDAPLAPELVDCVLAVRDTDGLVDCTVAALPDDQAPIFRRAITAMTGLDEPADDDAYRSAIGDILDDIDSGERDQVAAMIGDALDDQEDDTW